MPSPPTDVLGALGADARLAALCRTPADATGKVAGRPPLWVDPDDGVPGPGEKQGVEDDAATVLALLYSGEIPSRPLETMTRKLTVDLRIRTKGNRPSQRAFDIEQAFRDLWIDQRNHVLAPGQPEQLRVVSIDQWRGLQRISSSKAQGFDHVVSYVVEAYVFA